MFLVGSLFRVGSIVVWNFQLMGGCLGIHIKLQLTTSINEPLRRPMAPGQKESKHSMSDDSWTTSTYEMDNSAVQSRGSISSISTPNLTIDPHGTTSGNGPSEFVNHGLFLWNQTRQLWIGKTKPANRVQQLCEPKLSTFGPCLVKKFWLCTWNASYDNLLGNNKPFPQPIPLSEMVDFLVDTWEQEGMYD